MRLFWLSLQKLVRGFVGHIEFGRKIRGIVGVQDSCTPVFKSPHNAAGGNQLDDAILTPRCLCWHYLSCTGVKPRPGTPGLALTMGSRQEQRGRFSPCGCVAYPGILGVRFLATCFRDRLSHLCLYLSITQGSHGRQGRTKQAPSRKSRAARVHSAESRPEVSFETFGRKSVRINQENVQNRTDASLHQLLASVAV